jgi:GUN4-like
MSSSTEFIPSYSPQSEPENTVLLQTDRDIDYSLLQQLLAEQNFQAADQLTLQKLCELAGKTAVQRKWVYFSEIADFPIPDLQTINQLWLAYSNDKFGFSVQREIWLGVGKNWDKFWPKIGWKAGNNWTRYPQEFTWDLTAPKGHLPLSNQLRGVRMISSLLSHPAWVSPSSPKE